MTKPATERDLKTLKLLDGVKGLSAAEWAAVLARLIELGWLAWGRAKAPNEKAIVRAVERYQQWAGLKVDGFPGPVTQHSLCRPRFCGVPDRMQVGELCRWPHRRITWAALAQLPAVPAADVVACAAWGMSRIADVCNVTVEQTQAAVANIVMRHANLGGPGGTLADSFVPCGARATDTMRQRYDISELWYTGAGRPTQGRISLRAVMLHELLHAFGVDHDPPELPGGEVSLIQPFYRDSVLDLQPRDKQHLVNRYGPVITPVPPPVPPAPPSPPDPPVNWCSVWHAARPLAEQIATALPVGPLNEIANQVIDAADAVCPNKARLMAEQMRMCGLTMTRTACCTENDLA